MPGLCSAGSPGTALWEPLPRRSQGFYALRPIPPLPLTDNLCTNLPRMCLCAILWGRSFVSSDPQRDLKKSPDKKVKIHCNRCSLFLLVPVISYICVQAIEGKKCTSQELQTLLPQVSYFLLKWFISPVQQMPKDRSTQKSTQSPVSDSIFSLPSLQALC